MTGSEFALRVKARLNRLDTAFLEDVSKEEIYMFALDAMKSITLELVEETESYGLNKKVVSRYLSTLTKDGGEKVLTLDGPDGVFNVPDSVLYYLDLEVLAQNASDLVDVSWRPCRFVKSKEKTAREWNKFTRSYADRPAYTYESSKLIFFGFKNDFNCIKFRSLIVKQPETFVDNSDLSYIPFLKELQNKTTTLILENLESRRIQTQPAVSRS